MPPLVEGPGLQEAICTTLVQLCKVGVAYQTELSIKGTISVTVDKKRVILVHVDEHFDTGQSTVESSQTLPVPVPESQRVNNVSSDLSIARIISSGNNFLNNNGQEPPLPGVSHLPRAITESGINEVTSPLLMGQPSRPGLLSSSTVSSVPAPDPQAAVPPPPMGPGLAVPISFWQHAMRSVYSQIKVPQKSNPSLADAANLNQPLIGSTSHVDDPSQALDIKNTKNLTLSETIAIDLDSDSESFSHLQFDDDEDGGDKAGVSSTLGRSDTKNVIVIDDADLINDDVMEHSETDAASVTEDDERHKWSLHRSLNTAADLWPMKAEALEGARVQDGPFQSLHGDETESLPGDSMGRQPIDWPWENKREKTQTTVTSSACEICHKTFSFVSSAHLECHLVETHNITESKQLGPIPHKRCPHCDKKFRFQTTLEKHLFVHIEQKPYKCQKCPNAYCYEESLNIHKLSHEGNFTCSICNRTYSNRKLFQKHIVYMHEMRRSTRKNSKKKEEPQTNEQL